jgi:hypothetical protein
MYPLCMLLQQVKNVKHDGNITLDQIIDVARTMRSRSMARTLAGTTKVCTYLYSIFVYSLFSSNSSTLAHVLGLGISDCGYCFTPSRRSGILVS